MATFGLPPFGWGGTTCLTLSLPGGCGLTVAGGTSCPGSGLGAAGAATADFGLEDGQAAYAIKLRSKNPPIPPPIHIIWRRRAFLLRFLDFFGCSGSITSAFTGFGRLRV